jgi:hypothetical protein
MNGAGMDDRIKKRIFLFYAAGVVNLLMAVAVLVFGRGVVPDDKITWILAFFLGFAAIDFWMPQMMKKKMREDMKKLEEQRKAQGARGG